MSQQNTVKRELIELINAYGAQIVADSLDVTLRSIQNYVSEVKPMKPHENTARKIHEIYAKHKVGTPLLAERNEKVADDYQAKYIAALEQRIHDKDERIKYLMEGLNLAVSELQKHNQISRAYLKVLFLNQQQIMAALEKRPLTEIQIRTDKQLAEVLAGAS